MAASHTWRNFGVTSQRKVKKKLPTLVRMHRHFIHQNQSQVHISKKKNSEQGCWSHLLSLSLNRRYNPAKKCCDFISKTLCLKKKIDFNVGQQSQYLQMKNCDRNKLYQLSWTHFDPTCFYNRERILIIQTTNPTYIYTLAISLIIMYNVWQCGHTYAHTNVHEEREIKINHFNKPRIGPECWKLHFLQGIRQFVSLQTNIKRMMTLCV